MRLQPLGKRQYYALGALVANGGTDSGMTWGAPAAHYRLMQSLAARGLVEETRSLTGGLRFSITDAGITASSASFREREALYARRAVKS